MKSLLYRQSHFLSLLVVLQLFIFQFIEYSQAQESSSKFSIAPNENIVFLGTEWLELDIKHNYFEAILTQAYKDKAFHYLNLGWTGDTPKGAARGYFGGEKEGYKRLHDEINRLKPTMIMLGYGSNIEPGADRATIDQYMKDYERLVNDLLKVTKKIVIVSPFPAEIHPAPMHNPKSLNEARKQITDALKSYAETEKLPFADLYTPIAAAYTSSKEKLTWDGLRFTDKGYQRLASILFEELTGTKAPDFSQKDSKFDLLRTLLADKNELYFRRYRPQNETYLRGFRKHEQGKNAAEIPLFDEMIAKTESRINALLAGQPLPPPVAEPGPQKLTFDPQPPEEQRDSFSKSDQLQVNIFATEPMIANPIHMNFDGDGRLWVATSPIYPHIRPGAKPKDEIIILEDTDGDGQADKKTVFANDLLIPTAVLPDEKGGAYVANSTEILHLSDTDGDGVADQRRVVLSGFGTEDTHHILHTFRWGPDGAFYFNQSIYIHTHMETLQGVKRLMGSGVWRFYPETGEASIITRGGVNPWGTIFNKYGQSILSDGAGFQGLLYSFPGAAYYTAVGYSRTLKGLNPGHPKYCGLEIVSGDHFPEDWEGTLITSDFRGNRICRFEPKENASGYIANQLEDMMGSKNRAFRTVDIKQGPDGAIYLADWHNPIINHGEVDFRDPRRDYKHGRIWRITYKDRDLQKKPDFKNASPEELVKLLSSKSIWVRNMAKIYLKQHNTKDVLKALQKVLESPELHLESTWLFQALQQKPTTISQLISSNSHNLRAAGIRALSTTNQDSTYVLNTLKKSILDDHPQVRLEAVNALREIGTVESIDLALTVLEKDMDVFLDFALWTTLKKSESVWMQPFLDGKMKFAKDPKKVSFALQASGNPRMLQPLVDLVAEKKIKSEELATVLPMIDQYGTSDQLAVIYKLVFDDKQNQSQYITSLIKAGMRNARPKGDLNEVAQLFETQPAALRLAGVWKLNAQKAKLQEVALSPESKNDLRNGALQGLAAFKDFGTLTKVASGELPSLARKQAIIAAAPMDPAKSALWAADLLSILKESETQIAGEVIDAFLTRKNGPQQLAKALQKKKLNQTIASIALQKATTIGGRGNNLINVIRSSGDLTPVKQKLSPEEMAALLKEVKEVGSPERGELIYHREKLSCVKCHSIGGAGGKVGPDIVSLGASSPPDYIVNSMLNPSAKIKEGYHTTTVITNEGKVITGTQIKDGEDSIVMRDANNKEHIIRKDDIDEKAISKTSIMPAELTAKLPRDEFVDLIAFMTSLGKEGKYKVPKNRYVRRWLVNGKTVYSKVDGSIHLDDFKRQTVSFEIDVKTAGPIAIIPNSQDGVRMKREGQTENLRADRIVLDLPVGIERINVFVFGRSTPFTVEIQSIESSQGYAEPVNQ